MYADIDNRLAIDMRSILNSNTRISQNLLDLIILIALMQKITTSIILS